eukprot:COSAG06_NODE_4163_length_4509_cov_7.424490_1_plen_82_part_00
MSRMRFDQSAAGADTLTRARPLATSTERVSCHTEENLGVDQVVQVDVPVATGHSRARTEKLPRSRSPHPSSLHAWSRGRDA